MRGVDSFQTWIPCSTAIQVDAPARLNIIPVAHGQVGRRIKLGKSCVLAVLPSSPSNENALSFILKNVHHETKRSNERKREPERRVGLILV
jgi:hypothetical protein